MRFAPNVRFPSILVSIVVVAMLALTNGPFAHADVILYSGTNFDIVVSDPIDVGVSNTLKAVTLTAEGKNEGVLPNTFDSDKSGVHGTGITTPDDELLHQIWEFDAVQTPTLTLNVPGSIPQALDTHFLVYNANLNIIYSPAEDRPDPYSPEPDLPWGGYGTYLTGTFTDKTATLPSWDFAYLVVPNNTKVKLDFEIGAAGFPSETIYLSFLVPEPGALMLLVIGIFGLLVYVCRRR